MPRDGILTTGYRPCRDGLAPRERELYDRLLEAALDCRASVEVPQKVPTARLTELMNCMRRENPEAIVGNASAVRRTPGFGLGLGTARVLLHHGMPGSQALRLREAAEQEARQVLAACMAPATHAAAVALRLHDHLAANCRYAEHAPLRHEAAGALVEHAAVCDGIAKAYKLLCDRAGIRCVVVEGSSEGPHAWNAIELEGHWAHVDVTDDLAYGARPSHAFFGLSDEEIRQERTIASPCPACPRNLGLYESLGLYAHTEQELAKLLGQRLAQGEQDFEVKLGGRLVEKIGGPERLRQAVYEGLRHAGRFGSFELRTKRAGVIQVIVRYQRNPGEGCAPL